LKSYEPYFAGWMRTYKDAGIGNYDWQNLKPYEPHFAGWMRTYKDAGIGNYDLRSDLLALGLKFA